MKVQISILFFLFLQFIAIPTVHSCSCGGPDSFCETVQAIEEFDNFEGAIVALGKKKSTHEHGMDFEILTLYKGQETKSIVRVWGDVGHLCRQYVNGIENGQTLLLVLFRLTEDGSDNHEWSAIEKEGDYFLSFCGVHSLAFPKGDDSAAEDLGETVVDCVGENPFINIPDGDRDCVDKEMLVFPNPAKEAIFISLDVLAEDYRNTPKKIQVFNSSGKRVLNFNTALLNENPLRVEVENLSPGIYWIEMKEAFGCGERWLGKVVVI